ncbi:PREDICTED: uncharacterized protein LOC105359121 isoform X2 [Ceratosolen solmsi marchali]|uniref:Uncharacterized protein LOC105359121 isoform X2 n=1 Tax=Ceratosolen solmsi marchali TaxID=326594 RepID=A0AAJ6VK26_9HYME|nr:PREDICTED: uncharacterized protein LOC105359121 isoform X2 [Ceratosolen solmsi marchali]
MIYERARLAMADNNPDSQEARLKSVRRRLNFGEVNDGNLPTKNELELKFAEERAKYTAEKQAKWNFNFKEERPLEGRWEWKRVETGSESRAPEDADVRAEGAKGDTVIQAP